MKKRIRKKIAKDILGVRKLKVNNDECLFIEMDDNPNVLEMDYIQNMLKNYLGCKVVITRKKVDLTVVSQ